MVEVAAGADLLAEPAGTGIKALILSGKKS